MNYIISNSINNNLLLSYQFNSVPAGSNTLIWTIPALLFFSANSIRANVVITDSDSINVISNSIYSNTLTIPPSSVTSPAISATYLDLDQPITLFTSVLNWTPPFTYNFIISSAVTNAVIASSGPQSSNAFVYYTNVVGVLQANVVVTDFELPPFTENSTYSNHFTVASVLSIPIAPLIGGSGQIITFTTSINNGITPYTYNFIVSYLSNNTIVSSSGPLSANTFSYSTPLTGTFHANVIATDSANIPISQNSVYSDIFVIISGTGGTTTTIPYGGGGGAAGGGGGGGGPSPGVPIFVSSTKPVPIQNNTVPTHPSAACYIFDNLTQYNQANLTLNDTRFQLRVNFITPTSAGVTVNNSSYTLYANTTQQIYRNTDFNYTIELTNLSYVPIEDTVQLKVCSTPVKVQQQIPPPKQYYLVVTIAAYSIVS